MTQHLPYIRTLLVGLPTPASVARRQACGTERPGRNSMPDGPQDFDGGLGPAVRTVQHLNSLFVDATIAAAVGAVTRTDQWNVLRT